MRDTLWLNCLSETDQLELTSAVYVVKQCTAYARATCHLDEPIEENTRRNWAAGIRQIAAIDPAMAYLYALDGLEPSSRRQGKRPRNHAPDFFQKTVRKTLQELRKKYAGAIPPSP